MPFLQSPPPFGSCPLYIHISHRAQERREGRGEGRGEGGEGRGGRGGREGGGEGGRERSIPIIGSYCRTQGEELAKMKEE